MQGEVAAADLEAYKNAGLGVYQLLDQLQNRRAQMLVGGVSPWDASQATQTELFAGWVAYALQTLGDGFLQADYDADARTVGFVPEVTARQIRRFYAEVERWLCQCREAGANPDYRHGVSEIVSLPGWEKVEPCPMAHLQAMVTAARQLGERAAMLLYDVQRSQMTDDQKRELLRIDQLLEGGNTNRERAELLWGGGRLSDELHEEVERNLKRAIHAYFDAGQLAAVPSLIAGYDSQAAAAPAAALPGQSGFDPWCLTDPASRGNWQHDPAARRAIDTLWRFDPQPDRTLAIQREIDAALNAGVLAYATNKQTGQPFGHYFCCPWSAIYQAVDDVTIAGRRIRRGETFTFDVSAEEIAEGLPFKREILVARFSPTSEVDYCNPEEGRHHDD